MLKTEMQTARFYIKNKFKENPLGLPNCHKATCQRWLKFLKPYLDLMHYNFERTKSLGDANAKGIMIDKVEDLKNTIKLYSENGI